MSDRPKFSRKYVVTLPVGEHDAGNLAEWFKLWLYGRSWPDIARLVIETPIPRFVWHLRHGQPVRCGLGPEFHDFYSWEERQQLQPPRRRHGVCEVQAFFGSNATFPSREAAREAHRRRQQGVQ